MRILTQSPLLIPLRRAFFMTQSQPRTPLSAVVAHSRSPTPPLPTEPPNSPKRRRLHSPAKSKMSTPIITLDDREETVRRLLVDVGLEIDTYNRTSGARNKDPTVLRFTGGWVRDKILGIPSHDIDVGISRMTGYDFGLYLSDFLMRHYHSYGIETGAVHKIESNPEKSKHLETATMKILGLDIDLVNLRSEVYKGDSRIPQMEFGTPSQDAHRRDCTINALFYNLHSQRVEDFTELGLEDMEKKIIRTPLPPLETFEDDPLRILRLIRFSSRLGFEIVKEATDAMKLPKIKEALSSKISRERIGAEVEKMLRGINPRAALDIINSLGLYNAIFSPPINIISIPSVVRKVSRVAPSPILLGGSGLPEPVLWTKVSIPIGRMPIAVSALSNILTLSPEAYPGIASLTPTEHEIYISYLLAALTPWEGLKFEGVEKRKNIPAAATAIREGLKATNKVCETIARGFNNISLVREEIKVAEGEKEWRRGQAGKWIKICGHDWRCHIMCSLLLELVGVWGEGVEVPSPESMRIIKRYDAFVRRIFELDAADAFNAKPIIDGKELFVILEVERGPWVAEALARVLEWQWDNPGKGKEEALEWVKSVKESFTP